MNKNERFHVLSLEAKAISNLKNGAVIVESNYIEKALRIFKQFSYKKIETYKSKKEYIKPSTVKKQKLDSAKFSLKIKSKY